MWLANSQELLSQASGEFDTAWSALGNREVRKVHFWGDNPRLRVPRDGIVFAGLQKLGALIKRDEQLFHRLASQATLVVVDEAHISVAATYSDTITLLRRRESTGLLGLSATPGRTWNDRHADRELADLYGGNKVRLDVGGYGNPVDYLIEEGYLARPTFRVLDLNLQPLPAGKADDVHSDCDDDPPQSSSSAYLLAVVREVEALVERHERILVFSASVPDARNMALLLRRLGINADVVTGDTPAGQRASILRRFKGTEAQAHVIVNFGVLTTGFDAPNISAAVIARPTRSLVLYSQMVGRAIRGPKANGNTEAEIVTIVDPRLPGFGSVAAAFDNWEDVW